MAYAGTPVVRNQILCLLEPPAPIGNPPLGSIHLDTPAWWHWLETATSFYYVPTQAIYAYTVRKEKRRHGCYWYAYLKNDSKLHNAYVGRSADLTTHRLEQVAQTLRLKIQHWRRTFLQKGGTS